MIALNLVDSGMIVLNTLDAGLISLTLIDTGIIAQDLIDIRMVALNIMIACVPSSSSDSSEPVGKIALNPLDT